MKTQFILFCLLFGAVSLYASPRVSVYELSGSGRSSFNGSVKAKWRWLKNSEKVIVLKTYLVLESSSLSGFSQVSVSRESTRAKIKGSRLIVELASLTEKIQLSGASGTKTLQLKVRNSKKKKIIDRGCKKNSIELVSKAKKIPFYLGISCKKGKKKIQFSLNFPEPVSIENSTLFDVKGKGEPWRLYHIQKDSTGELGEFSLVYKGKSYTFNLKSTQLDVIQEPVPTPKWERIILMSGLGYSMLSVSGPDIDASDSKPALVIKVPHYKLFGKLGAGLDSEIAIPLSSGENAISLFHFEPSLNYSIEMGDSLRLLPGVSYLIHSQVHDLTQIGIEISEIGFGFELDYNFANSFLVLEAKMSGFFTEGIQSHYSLGLGYYYKKEEGLGYGAGLKMQSFSVKSLIGIERSFSQMSFFLALVF